MHTATLTAKVHRPMPSSQTACLCSALLCRPSTSVCHAPWKPRKWPCLFQQSVHVAVWLRLIVVHVLAPGDGICQWLASQLPLLLLINSVPWVCSMNHSQAMHFSSAEPLITVLSSTTGSHWPLHSSWAPKWCHSCSLQPWALYLPPILSLAGTLVDLASQRACNLFLLVTHAGLWELQEAKHPNGSLGWTMTSTHCCPNLHILLTQILVLLACVHYVPRIGSQWWIVINYPSITWFLYLAIAMLQTLTLWH